MIKHVMYIKLLDFFSFSIFVRFYIKGDSTFIMLGLNLDSISWSLICLELRNLPWKLRSFYFIVRISSITHETGYYELYSFRD